MFLFDLKQKKHFHNICKNLETSKITVLNNKRDSFFHKKGKMIFHPLNILIPQKKFQKAEPIVVFFVPTTTITIYNNKNYGPTTSFFIKIA